MRQTGPRMPPCAECGRRPATCHGLCPGCDARAMVPERTMHTDTGRAAQQTWRAIRKREAVTRLVAEHRAQADGAAS